MTTFLQSITSWNSLLIIGATVVGIAFVLPVILLLAVRIYPPEHESRREFEGEYFAKKLWRHPVWLLGILAFVVVEAPGARRQARRAARRSSGHGRWVSRRRWRRRKDDFDLGDLFGNAEHGRSNQRVYLSATSTLSRPVKVSKGSANLHVGHLNRIAEDDDNAYADTPFNDFDHDD